MGLFSRKSKLEEAEEARQKDLETKAFNKSFADESIRQAARRGRIAAAQGKKVSQGASGVLGKLQDVGRHIGPGPALTGGKNASSHGLEFGFPSDTDFWTGKKKKA
jgi:hypothetical protein